MVSLRQSLFTGYSGVQVSQAGLNITGNNIANVNTPGYSRQMTENVTKGVYTSQGLTIGTGSDVLRVGAARDNLANKLLTGQQAKTAFSEELASGLSDIENLTVETDSSGINFRLNEFFNGVEETVARPADIAARQQLLTAAENLTTELRGRNADLFDLQYRTNADVQTLVDRVNEITTHIADINEKISSFSKPPQDLIDDRYAQINELSKLVGVTTYDLPNNQVQINLAGSNQILVATDIRNTLQTNINPANNGFYNIELNNKGTVVDVTSTMTTGVVGAKLQLRDVEVPAVRTRLDNLAAGLIIQFNTLHQTGTNLDGATNLRFFDPANSVVLGATPIGTPDANRYDGVAGTITLSADLLYSPANPEQGYDPREVALSLTGAVGDNQIALAMADLRNNANVIDTDRDGDSSTDSSGTFESYHTVTQAQLGNAVRTSLSQMDTQQALLEQAEVRRDEVSGVSLDEEAVNLTQYQRAFEASSRFLSVINQLTAEILQRLG